MINFRLSLWNYQEDIIQTYLNPIQNGLFRRCSRMGGPFCPPPLKSVTHTHISYNDKTWRSYTLSKEDLKNI